MLNEQIYTDATVGKSTYPPEFVVNAMLDLYNLKKEQLNVVVRRNEIRVIVFLADVRDNIKKFSADMDKCGYFVAQTFPQQDRNGKMWQFVAYEPYVTPNVLDEVQSIGGLIHITSPSRAEKIKQEGIVPKSESTLYKYPNRVYLLSGRFGASELKALAREMCKHKSKVSWDEIEVIHIDTDMMPDDFLIYPDPNQDNGYFTYKTISPEWIYKTCNILRYSPLADFE